MSNTEKIADSSFKRNCNKRHVIPPEAWHSTAKGSGAEGQRADEAQSWYVREEINSLSCP